MTATLVLPLSMSSPWTTRLANSCSIAYLSSTLPDASRMNTTSRCTGHPVNSVWSQISAKRRPSQMCAHQQELLLHCTTLLEIYLWLCGTCNNAEENLLEGQVMKVVSNAFFIEEWKNGLASKGTKGTEGDLLRSQLSPAYPSKHWHVYLFSSFSHRPFLHGLYSHSLTPDAEQQHLTKLLPNREKSHFFPEDWSLNLESPRWSAPTKRRENWR